MKPFNIPLKKEENEIIVGSILGDGCLEFGGYAGARLQSAFILSVDNFQLNEVKLLMLTLKKNFGIESSIQTPSSRGKRYPKLYIGAKGREKFLNLITPCIHKCFEYKLPQNRVSPSETDSLPPWQGGDRRYLSLKERKLLSDAEPQHNSSVG